MRPQRPCIEPTCTALHRNPGPRCGPHERVFQKQRNRKRTQYQGDWQVRSRRARAAEPWCHCDLAGHGHDGRVCARLDDLTTDHQYERVECRSCNSAHRRQPGGAQTRPGIPSTSEFPLTTNSLGVTGD